MDNSEYINGLEVHKNTLYLNFINDIGQKQIVYKLHSKETQELIHKYNRLYSEIQYKFLNLYNIEMTYYG